MNTKTFVHYQNGYSSGNVYDQFATTNMEALLEDQLEMYYPRRSEATQRLHIDSFLCNMILPEDQYKSGRESYRNVVRSSSRSLSHANIEEFVFYLSHLTNSFMTLLRQKSKDRDDEECNSFLDNLLSISGHRTDVLLWIQEIFNNNVKDESIIVGLLNLISDYSFEEMNPIGPTIAAACKNHKSLAVKSAALSLFGHWCNEKALHIIEAFEEPKEMILRTKYRKLKNIIRSKCTI